MDLTPPCATSTGRILLLSLLALAGGIEGAEQLRAAETAASRLLVIGDSQSVGVFGKELDAQLRTRIGDEHVDYYASCGSSPAWWFSGQPTKCGYAERHPGSEKDVSRVDSATPKFLKLLEQHRPTAVIVQMGGNLVGYGPAEAGKQAERLVAEIHSRGLPCVWVGPPHGTKRPQPATDQVIARLAEVVSPRCTFINSYEITRYPDGVGDGIHYDSAGKEGVRRGKQWAQDVIARLPDGFTRASAAVEATVNGDTGLKPTFPPGIHSEIEGMPGPLEGRTAE